MDVRIDEDIEDIQGNQPARNSNLEAPSTPNFSTGLAHIILAGTSGWAIHETACKKQPVAFGCFAYLLGHGLLGVLSHTHPNVSVYIEKLYNQSFKFAQTLPLALINIQMHQKYQQPDNYIYAIAVSTAPPIISDLILPTPNSEYVNDVIQLANAASLGYLGATFKKYWMSGMAAFAGINHLVVKIVPVKFHVPKVDLHTMGLGVLVILALYSINE